MRLRGSTLVITGATSGVGLATARLASRKGARLVLVGRRHADLERVAATLPAPAAWAVADIADRAQVEAAAQVAIRTFGGFDAWVQAAAVGLHAPVLEVSLEDERRLFEVNFWGSFHCTHVALAHLRDKGGSIVAVSSVLADRSAPWQGSYAATEHATKAWFDALRIELRKEGIPVGVSVVKVGGADTPFARHAAAPFGKRLPLPPPILHPDVVARAILRCVRKPRRDVAVGDVGLVALEKVAPSLGDALLHRWALRRLREQPAAAPDAGGLHVQQAREGRVRGGRGFVFRRSPLAAASLHPVLTALAAAGVAGAAALGRAR